MIRKRAKTAPRIRTITGLIGQIKSKNLILRPEYQREYVWENKSDKDELMRSIFLSYPIGTITINANSETQKDEIVDGLQRIRTLLSFVEEDERGYKKIGGDVSKNIIDQYIDQINEDAKWNKNAQKIINNIDKDKTTLLTYNNLPPTLKGVFDEYEISTNVITNSDKENIHNFFRVLQIQERLKAGEIINSLIDNEVVKTIREYKNIETNLEKIEFKNKRQDFQKYLVLFHGILSEKIKLGVSDKIIIQYAEKKMKPNFLFNRRMSVLLEKLDNIEITKKFEEKKDRSFNKFCMKLLISLYILQPEYVENKNIANIILKLYKFSKLNSQYNSIKLKTKQKIQKKHKKQIEEISIISKTTHKNETLYEKLKYLIEFLDSVKI